MKVFFSHSWHDKPLVLDIADGLSAVAPSVQTWIDCDTIRPGQEILDAVEAELASTDLVAVIWTENSAASDGVAHELDFVRANGIPAVFCVTPKGHAAGLPQGFGRMPKVVDVGQPLSEDGLNLVILALAEFAVQDLSADPEVAALDSSFLQQLLRVNGLLSHVLGRERSSQVQGSKASWARRLGIDTESLESTGRRELDSLDNSLTVMEQVLEAVQGVPTDLDELQRLREQAIALQATDPVGGQQAALVIDLRLAEPLR